MYTEAAATPRSRTGAVDLDVVPKRTEVFVDGRYMGTAGKFDGYPGYLWLDEGTHTLTFTAEGYRTFSQSFVVRSGMLTDVRFEMEPGEASPPAPTAPRAEPAAGPPPVPPVRREQGPPLVELAGGEGRDRFHVQPSSASVYLDGRFLGTGSELLRMHDGLLVNAGSHVLEVVHPRYETDRTNFRIDLDEEIEVRIELDGAAPGVD